MPSRSHSAIAGRTSSSARSTSSSGKLAPSRKEKLLLQNSAAYADIASAHLAVQKPAAPRIAVHPVELAVLQLGEVVVALDEPSPPAAGEAVRSPGARHRAV